jgi:hypothetical protein
MSHSRMRRDAGMRAKQVTRQGLGAVACAVIVTVMIIGTAGGARARGGYGEPKSPTAFAPKELLLIEKCRALAETAGMNSAPFQRQCSTVRPYVYF